MRISKKLNLALVLLSLFGFVAGSKISEYCQNKKQIALKNPQRVLAIETKRNLEGIMWEKIAIEDSNMIYSAAQIRDNYQAIKQEYMELSKRYNQLAFSEELAVNSANIRIYEQYERLGGNIGDASLVLLVLSGLGLITEKKRISIDIRFRGD